MHHSLQPSSWLQIITYDRYTYLGPVCLIQQEHGEKIFNSLCGNVGLTATPDLRSLRMMGTWGLFAHSAKNSESDQCEVSLSNMFADHVTNLIRSVS